MYWSKLTTRGAMMGGWLGLLTAVVLMILGPTIWVQILGHEPFNENTEKEVVNINESWTFTNYDNKSSTVNLPYCWEYAVSYTHLDVYKRQNQTLLYQKGQVKP